ncbi:hypothetical protein DFJ73DRAFT_188538 [Zopfochytrium polystomum]|nr:hypothetical protein DFJ73DRAFT_188538 [Zopfochytrium polystomum]
MLLYLPLLADIPLLLLFVPTPTLSLLEFKKAAPSELSIASFLSSCGGPISMVEVTELNLREGDSHDLNGALSRLQEGLNWSIEFGGGTFVMRDNILKDLATTGIAESITFAFGKVDESVPTSEFSIDVDNHMKTFNTLVDLYNIQVDAVITLLTHPSSTHAPFPAPNFTPVVGPHRLPPLTWNAPATVDFVVRALSAFRLPHMTAPKGAGPIHQRNSRRPGQAGSLQTVKELYDTYATRIATGAVPGHAWSLSPPSLIPSIWSRLAPFTHSYGPAPRFPFKSVASCIAAAAWAALEEEVRRVGSLVGGGTSGPWYDARGLPGVVQAVSEKASEVLSTWMEQVVNVWAPSSSDDEELANGGLEANGTGDGGHDASVATNGVILANTLPPGSQKRRLSAITVANAETALPSSPTAKALKRRLDEIIASAREEVESSKRRFSEL